MPKMTEVEIAGRLPAAKGWERLGDMLVRSWQFPSSRRALEFVKEVVERAERAGHHPDVILSYRTVRLELSTHAEGGVTDADFALVEAIEEIPIDR
jgi:4a-hydroxytetrahydrobiopterin dehydratase